MGPDGLRQRDHLLLVKKAGFPVKELDEAPELPWPAAHLWRYFLELQMGRQGGMSPSPLTYQEIAAWASLTGVRLEPWEVRILKQLDYGYITSGGKNGG